MSLWSSFSVLRVNCNPRNNKRGSLLTLNKHKLFISFLLPLFLICILYAFGSRVVKKMILLNCVFSRLTNGNGKERDRGIRKVEHNCGKKLRISCGIHSTYWYDQRSNSSSPANVLLSHQWVHHHRSFLCWWWSQILNLVGPIMDNPCWNSRTRQHVA